MSSHHCLCGVVAAVPLVVSRGAVPRHSLFWVLQGFVFSTHSFACAMFAEVKSITLSFERNVANNLHV